MSQRHEQSIKEGSEEQRKPIRRNSKNDFACTPARYPVAATHSSITGIVAAASTPSTIFKASSSSVSESLAETSNVLSASTSGSMVSEPSDSIAVQLRSDTPPPPPPAGWLEWSWVDVSRPPPSQSEKDPLEILSVSSGVVSSASPFFSPAVNTSSLVAGGPYMQTADTHSSHAMDALALDGTTHAGPSYTPLRHTATPPPFARLVNLAKPAGISEAAVWNPARYNTEQVGPSEIYIPVPLTTSVRSDPLTEQAASTILQGSGFITLSQSTGNMDDFGTGVGMPSPSQSPVSLSSPQPLHSIGGDSAILFNSQHILNYLGIPGAIQREAIARPPSREAATAAEPIYRASSAPPVDLRPSSLSRSASPERPSQPKRPSPICHTQSPSREKKSAEKLATTGKSTSSFIGGYNIRYFSFYEEPDGLKSQRKGGSAGPPAKRPWSVIEILGAVVAAGLGGYALMKFGSLCYNKLSALWVSM